LPLAGNVGVEVVVELLEPQPATARAPNSDAASHFDHFDPMRSSS
jgi:hypothetical protein